jgi:hypothetical protein
VLFFYLPISPCQFAAFEDEVGIYLVTEYASRGDVFGELDRRGGSMTESDAVRQVRRVDQYYSIVSSTARYSISRLMIG